MIDQTFQHRVLLLVDVDVTFEIPTMLLPVVDCRLKLILSCSRHVVDIVRSEEVRKEVVVGSTTTIALWFSGQA